ncbi:P-loop NTPase [candidate division KSB1 bacterium]|nr:P-loop NTPase [candidate division KSB1 bacterium]
MNNSVFVQVAHKQYGPFTKSELKNLVSKGQFKKKDLVWDDDEGEWIEAAKYDQLKSLFAAHTPEPAEKTIFAIGGGKGGVGKTVITSSLGVGLSAMGYEVVLIDADFGGANLHISMGMLEPEYTFLDYYTMQRETLSDIMLDTPIENLKLISGACGTVGLANPKYSQKLRFINELKMINADFVLLDLGAGSSYSVIDFFLAVDQGIIVASPEPTSIQESFDFLKVCLLRKLYRTFKKRPDILTALSLDGIDNLSQLTLPVDDLVSKLNTIDKDAGAILETVLEEFKPKLILNMVVEPEDIKEGLALKAAAAELLSIDIEYLGYIEYDREIGKSVRELRPFILHNPKSKASKSLSKLITIKLLNKQGFSSLRTKIRLKKGIRDASQTYSPKTVRDNDTICSVKCFYWDDCEFRNGGFPCTVRQLDPLFKT